MRVLSLDLATTTGWALQGGGVVTSGSQCFARLAVTKSRGAQHIGEPFAQFHRWLVAKLHDDKPEVIAYEEAAGHFKSVHASRAVFGFRSVMLCVAAGHGVPCIGYEAQKVKKFWTGKGNADKDAMMAETRVRFPDLQLSDANEADALAILHLHAGNVEQASFSTLKL